MKTAFVIAGRAPAWVNDQIRYAAQQLTDDGRVLLAYTDGFTGNLQLPGDVGGCTLLGVASSGYPLWTGRASSVFGLRRRQDTVVIAWFEEVRPIAVCCAALIARMRRERVLVHVLQTRRANESLVRRACRKVLSGLSHSSVDPTEVVENDRTVAFAICEGDPELAEMVVAVASAMAADTAVRWRFVISSDDDEVADMVRNSTRNEIMSVESDAIIQDLVLASDVLVVRHGDHVDLALGAAFHGAVSVIVDHPVAARVSRRFDGVMLARPDVSSLLVALESARRSVFGQGRSAAAVRMDGDRIVRAVRSRSTQTS